MANEDNRPASARPIADEHGRTADVRYSKNHLARLVAMKRAGRPINLPPGVNMDDYPETPATPPTRTRPTPTE